MKSVRYATSRELGRCVLFVIGFLLPVNISFGQFGGSNPPVTQHSSITGVKGSPETRMTLEAARRGFEEQLSSSEEKAEEVASRYRDEMGNESPGDAKLARLRKELEAAVRESFKLQILLQKTRLQIAELDLIELQAKSVRRESLAENIIERRVLDLIADKDLTWPSQVTTDDRHDSLAEKEPSATDDEARHTIPKFASPRELLEYSRDATKDGDWGTKMRRFIELMEKDEVDRLAGICLRTASMIRSAAQLAQTFAAFGPPGQNAELMEVAKGLDSLISESRRKKPSHAARDAYEEICATDINIFQVMLAQTATQTPRPIMDAESYSRKLRTAAKALKNPADFIVRFVTVLQKLEAYKSNDDDVNPSTNDQEDWQIEEDGDRATVTSSSPKSTNLPMYGKGMKLVRRDDTWRISSMISDREIEELQQGLRQNSRSNTPEAPSNEDDDRPEDLGAKPAVEEEQPEK